MNTRALVYLGLASATLAGAYLYVQSLPTETVTAPTTQGDAAQALESLSIIDGSLTTGSYRATVRQGQRIQFLVHSNQTDSLIVEGLDARVPLPGNQTTLVSIAADTPGTHAIELDLSGTTIGSIEVTP
ncbi:MAG: hypothetical protein A0129_12535 [Limnobacter sp. CACIAM 66H1]|uniref:hypothetical protein n=1 Tax=Limnobacter sp. CACIAM 66H1 TaxID=1813033 RepID=UPI0007A8EC7C|nr:hypothetical protein [Limnobacter sp. CACIAM 66H1]KYP10510.1 MAG: hypothetical protein A0129_12535 [Limnobacter sp. CACIAM 66H1]